jgi:signal peptidase II
MGVRSRLTLLLLMGIPTVGCDQVTKAAAVRNLAGRPPVEYLDGAVLLQYAENPGVLFSIGSGLSDDLRFLLFTVIMGSLLVLTGVAFLRVRHLGRVGLVGLALALSGGLGNLMDRVAYGYVVDFISVGVGGVHTAIWNLADAAILFGLLLFALAGQLREVPVDS